MNKKSKINVESDNRKGCPVCGGELVKIRGRYPGTPEREVCPTCLQERLERIHVETASDWGIGYTEKAIKI